MRNSAAQKLETVARQETHLTPLRVIPLRPSLWQQVRAWAKRTLTEERIAEVALVTTTLFLYGLFFFWLHQALQDYTISPWP